MNKKDFLTELKNALTGLPQDDVEERLSFYGEMIDDRVEEGKSEEEAVAEIGSVDDVAAQIVADIPLTRLVKEKITPKRSLRAWEIVLIAVGFPLWFPLLAAAGVVALALYLVVWVLIVALWAVEVSLWAGALGGIVLAVICAAQGQTLPLTALLGAGLFCAGLSVFLFCGCKEASKGILRLTGKAAARLKSRFLRKECVK